MYTRSSLEATVQLDRRPLQRYHDIDTKAHQNDLKLSCIPVPLLTPTPSPPPTFIIPDFISYNPFPFKHNLHEESVMAETLSWMQDMGVLPSQGHRKCAAFESYRFGYFTAMAYPDASYERLRIVCDFINILFAFDDLTDEGGLRKDEQGTKKASDIVLNSLHHPYTYKTNFKCGRVFSDFWARALGLGCSPGTHRRFLEYTDLYVQGVYVQVINRTKDYIPDVEEFIALRRDTGALKMCFAMGEYAKNLYLPDEVFEDPIVQLMEAMANDIVTLSNDIYSYNIEQAQDDTCNLIDVVMNQYSFGLQEAMDWSGDLVKERIDTYVAAKAQLPTWGTKVDAELKKYLCVMEEIFTANFYWSMDCERYFGDQLKNVQETLCVRLLPKQAPRGQIAIPDLH